MSNWYDSFTSTTRKAMQRLTGIDPNDTSERAVWSRIYSTAQSDPYKAQQMMSAYQTLQIDPTSKYYNPYSTVTNRSVSNLSSYGIDTSNIDDNFFQKYDYLRNYLRYDGTTNTPSKPSAKASNEEKAAYEFYQIWASEDATRKAENQWSALQKEVKYWASAKDRNYSDEEILGRIDWSKYDELVKMDENKRFKPNEYNRVIGYSKDALYAAMWEARNPTFTGNLQDAMVNSYLGTGNKWKKDELISEKLNPGSKSYSPYSVGSTMDAERAYFGVDSFDKKWIADNRTRIVTGTDETAKKYFENIRKAVDYTEKLKAEAKAMKAEIDDWLSTTSDASDIINAIRDNSDYKDLFDLDGTLVSTDLKATSSAVDYRWDDITDYIFSECDKKNKKKRSHELVAGIHYPVGSFNPVDRASGDDYGGYAPGAINVPPAPEKATEEPVTTEPAVNPRMQHETEPSAKPIATGGRAAHEGMTAKPQREEVPAFSETEIALDAATRAAYEGIKPLIRDIGTKEEQRSVLTNDTILRDASVAALKGFQTTVKDFADVVKTDAFAKFEGVYGENYDVIRNYEQKQEDLEKMLEGRNSIISEYAHLQWVVSAEESVRGLDGNQYQYLIYLSNLQPGEDPSWDAARDYIVNNDESDEFYDNAVISIYTRVMGMAPEWAGDTMESAREKVKLWIDYTNSSKDITEEELTRYKELSRLKSEYDKEIGEIQDYLDANDRAYSDAKRSNDFTETIYNAACGMDRTLNPSVFSQVQYIYDTAATDITYQYAGYYGYDVDVEEGRKTTKEAAIAAEEDARNVTAVLEGLEKVYSDLTKQGVKLGNSRSVENQIASFKDYAQYSAAAALDGRDDFESVVSKAVGDTRSFSAEEGVIAEVAKTGKSSDRFNTATELAEGVGSSLALVNSNIPDALYSINQQEAKRYFYLKETEGEEKAKKYLDLLLDPDRGMLTVRHMTELQNDLYNFASDTNSIGSLLAVPANIALSLGSWVEPAIYRIKQGFAGKEVSPYNAAYTSQVAVGALGKGTHDAVAKSYSWAPSFVSEGMANATDIAMGAANFAVASEAADSFFNLLGVDLGNLASGLSSPTLTAKVAKSAAEVVIPTLNEAESKYRQRAFLTNDQTALSAMYAVDFASGLATHAVIMSGLHADFNADSSGTASRVADFFKKILRTDSAVGVSTFLGSGAEAVAEKALMGANSEWQKNVDKYRNEYNYPLAVAQEMADQQMWADVNEQMWGAIVQSTIRTGIQGAVNFLGTKVGNGLEKVKKAWQNVNNFIKKEFSSDNEPYIKDDFGNPISLKEIKDSKVFEKNDPGYNVSTGEIRDPDNKVIGHVPENTIGFEYGETVLINRAKGDADTFLGYVVNPEDGSLLLVNSKGNLVPYGDVALGGTEINFTGKIPESYTQAREFATLEEVYKGYINEMGKYYADYRDVIYANPISEAEPVAQGEPTPSAAFSMLNGEVTSQPVMQQESAPVLGLPAGDSEAKALQTVMAMYDVSSSAATTGTISLLNTGNDVADTAAGEIIVGDFAFGDSRTVAIVFAQAYQTPYNNEEINAAIADAALTNGEGNAALHNMFDKTNLGQPITSEDVNALISGVNADRMRNPKAFDATKQATITGQRVADETVRIASQNTTVSSAKKTLTSAKNALESAQKRLDEAEEEREAVFQNAQDSITTLAESGLKADVGPVQQTTAQANGADDAVSAAEEAVVIQEQKVAEAEKSQQETNNKVMTEARQQAQEVVDQQIQQEQQTEQQRIVEAVAKYKPHLAITVRQENSNGDMVNVRGEDGKPINKAVTVRDNEGKEVTLIGVYDVTRHHVIYMTDDGRLVSEADTSTRVSGNSDETENRRRIGDVVALTEDDDLAAAVNELMDRSESARVRTKHPAVTPFRYLPSSFPINVNGNEIQIIGIAGKEDFDNGSSPVIIGIDGSLYSVDDESISDQLPREYEDIIFDDFYELEEHLPLISNDKITRIEEASANGNGEPEEQISEAEVPVQGNDGSGNYGTELAGQSGQPVGFGSDGDAELGGEGSPVGSGGLPGEIPERNRSAASRTNARFRSIIDERIVKELQPNASATDPDLQDETDRVRFSSALSDAVANMPNSGINPVTEEQLINSNAVIMLSPDGTAGIAVGQEGAEAGKILTLFSDKTKSGKTNTIPYLVANAINKGGYKIDTPDGVMNSVLQRFGFEPVARVKNEDGTSTVLWLHKGDPADTVARLYMLKPEDGGYKRTSESKFEGLPTYDNLNDAEMYREMIRIGKDRDFMITHSSAVENIISSLERGNLFGASYGVTKPYQHSTVYGFGSSHGQVENVTCIMKKEAFENNPLVKLLGGDAWTPTFPEGVEWTDGRWLNEKTGETYTDEELLRLQYGGHPAVYGIYKNYENFEEMKADLGRLADNDSVAMQGWSEKMFKDIEDLYKDSTLGLWDTFDRAEKDRLMKLVGYDESEAKYKTEDEAFHDYISKHLFRYMRDVTSDKAMQDALAKIGINVNEEVAGEYLDSVNLATGALVDYFEIKDFGTTPTSMIAGMIIPRGNDTLEYILNEKGIPFTYWSGDGKSLRGKARDVTNFYNALKSTEKTKAPKGGSDKKAGLMGLLDVSATIQKAKESQTQTVPPHITASVATLLQPGNGGGIGTIEMDAAQELITNVCDGDVRLAKAVIEACAKLPPVDENGIKRDIVYALYTNGRGREALQNVARKVANEEEVTSDDVYAIQSGLTDDYSENHHVFDDLEERDNEPVDEYGKQASIPDYEDMERKDVAWEAPEEPEKELIGINRIMSGFGLSGEKDEIGMTQLYDSLGNRFGYTYEDKNGNTRVGISMDGGYDIPDVHNILKDAGFVTDPNNGEWVLSASNASEQITPTNANQQPETPTSVEDQGLPPTDNVTPTNVNPPTPPNGEPPVTPEGVTPEVGQRQWGIKGAQQNDILSEKTKKRLLSNDEYIVDHNEDELNRAMDWIHSHSNENDPSGLYGAVSELESGELNLLNKDNQVRIMAAITMAAESGDQVTEGRLSDQLFNSTGTDLGQALQARKIWMMLTPVGRKLSLKREADRIRDEYQQKGKDLRFGEGQTAFHISEETLDAAANAKTEEEFEAARRMMEKEIAEQIPSDMQLRLRTFRMTSMLANPRTHLRNVVGNSVGALMVETKNVVATGLDVATGVPKGQRTHSITRTPESIEFANQDFPKMKDTLQGTSKYFELSEVERDRKAFGSGEGRTALGRAVSRTVGKKYQQFADWSSGWLEKEDVVFLKYHYTRALSGFMTARGLKPEDMKGKTLKEAREYAVLEAQKATYRSPNALATWLNSVQWKPARKTIDAIQPFVKTPSNIVKMGVEYSPVGLVSTLVSSAKKLEKYQAWEAGGFKGKRPHGAMSPSEVVDKLSAGITGTMIAGLGAWLFSLGVLKVKATDAEKEHGVQDYSLNIGGKSYGIGNLVPFNIPLMFGATLYNEFTDEDDSVTGFKEGNYAKGAEQVFARTLSAIKNLAEPVVDTTMMSSLNSLLNVTGYSNGDLTLGTLGEKVIANYISSYFPAIIGAGAKVVDPVRRKSFVEAGDKLNIWKAMIEQVQNKIPFLSTMNVPYLNSWGETEGSENPGAMDYFNAFLQNVVYPDKIQTVGDGELDMFLEQLSKNANTNVQPKNEKSVSVNGKTIKLNDQQWYQYNKERGQLSKELLQKLVERPEFVCLANSPEIQAELVKKVYKYAKAKAALGVFPEKEVKDSWTKGALEAKDVIDYIFAKEEESAKDKSNKAHKDSLYASIMDYNLDAAKMDISYLKRGGTDNSSIRSSVTSKVKPLYKEMYNDRDAEGIARLKNFLISLNIGYTNDSFKNWHK